MIGKMKTPQTDDLARGNHVVPTEWAEQLERERDEARADAVEAWRFADLWLAVADVYLDQINKIKNDIQKN
jgi:hypothetical protein